MRLRALSTHGADSHGECRPPWTPGQTRTRHVADVVGRYSSYPHVHALEIIASLRDTCQRHSHQYKEPEGHSLRNILTTKKH